MAITVDFNDVHPGTIIRVGLHAAGPIGRTFYLRITESPEQLPDGRIGLVGLRVTPYGNYRESLALTISVDHLFPAVMSTH